jgi:hypothetical protein
MAAVESGLRLEVSSTSVELVTGNRAALLRVASNVGRVVREIKIMPLDTQTKVWCYKGWYVPVGMMLTQQQNTNKNLVLCNTHRDHYYVSCIRSDAGSRVDSLASTVETPGRT